MQTRSVEAVTVMTVGTTLTSGVTSTSAAIPTDSSGSAPRFIRVSATAAAYVKLGITTATATANDMLVQPGDATVMLATGMDHIACIQDSVAGKVNVVPLEEQ